MFIKTKITGRRLSRLLLLTVTGALLITGCGKKREKIDLSSIHTTAAAETMESQEETGDAAEAETSAATTEVVTTSAAATGDTGKGGSSSSKNIATRINTYTAGKVSIEYPSVTNMSDGDQATAIDKLMKLNALSIIEANELDTSTDSLTVTCKVLSADRNRITALYTGTMNPQGAAHPTQVFYSNTIDVNKIANLGFSKFADPYTMAGYVLSNDCEFYNTSADVTAELMKAKNDMTLQEYTDLFNHADFPVGDTFPESFSYEDGGTIFFSIPVPHALGDYAIVKYTPENK